MDLTLINVVVAIGAGIASIASPCVLPVLPIVLSGTTEDSKFRPALIALGISIAFISMGILSSLFGVVVGPNMRYIEKGVAVFIFLTGVLTLLDFSLFKKITIFNRIASPKGRGSFSGFLLGLVLGLVWIPCVGPFLSSILATVAGSGSVVVGVVLLTFYAIGFSIPIFVVGYGSGLVREKFLGLKKHPLAVRIVSGAMLTVFGVYIFFNGMLF